MMDLELVRGDERLVCDRYIWRNTCEMARAFGWRPKFISSIRLSKMKLVDQIGGVEVVYEDALSLARAILSSIDMLATIERLQRRQAASYLWFTVEGSFDGNSIFIDLEDPARIASFCNGGGLHVKARS
jgi:hypothetical protein